MVSNIMRSLVLLGTCSVALAALDTCRIASNYFGNDAAWYIDRIPFFESSDGAITDIYYYRQKIFRAHQRDLGALGYMTTEFLDDVSWEELPYGSLNDATGFHLLEGRWNRDLKFKNDYAAFEYGPHAHPRAYTESMATSVWQGYLVDGVVADVVSHFDAMQGLYQAWVGSNYDTAKQMFYIEPIADATEYTIASIDASCGTDGFGGGQAFRPSINSYQYGNARAIANIATLLGNTAVANDYNSRASVLKDLVQDNLWSSTFDHFTDRYFATTDCVTYWDPIRGRELVGYVPWAHDLPDDNTTYAPAWYHIIDPTRLQSLHGSRTVEPSYQYYMVQYRYAGTSPECQWNGPVWPFQTTQVLTGLANLLDHYPATASLGVVSRTDYTNLLRIYANLHYNPNRNFDIVIEEDYNGDTGAPIVGLARSAHYFHSGYIDLVLSGLVGIRPRADNVLEVNPLASSDITYFRVENILYHGNDVAVQWDSTGGKYGTQGLIIEVGGVQVASSATLTRLTVGVPLLAPPTFPQPTTVSVQLQDDGSYPLGSVSVPGADTAKIHDSIDGRVFFFTETDYVVATGWQTPVGDGTTEYWYQIDFGAATALVSSEIAFFDHADVAVAVPLSYRIQVNDNGAWRDVPEASYGAPVANGITQASWAWTSANLIRLVFTPQSGSAVRLVEWKVFDGLVSPASTTCA